MPLFGRRRGRPMTTARPPGVPGLAGALAAQGWRPAGAQPFGQDLGKAVHRITRVLYGVPPGVPIVSIGDTIFSDAFSARLDGRTVTVANAWTYIEPSLMNVLDHRGVVTACAVELPAVLPPLIVQPRRTSPLAPRSLAVKTGDPAFDARFSVAGASGMPGGADEVLTPAVRQRIMADDDWVFHAEGHLLGCVGKGTFRTFEEIRHRVAEVMGVVTAIPESVLPRRVDHSADDLAARIGRLDGIEDAMAFLQELSEADRERLARSDTPLAAFADVRTPEEAIARFQSLDTRRRLQLMAMFMRTEGG